MASEITGLNCAERNLSNCTCLFRCDYSARRSRAHLYRYYGSAGETEVRGDGINQIDTLIFRFYDGVVNLIIIIIIINDDYYYVLGIYSR